jgi:hypothetical protein
MISLELETISVEESYSLFNFKRPNFPSKGDRWILYDFGNKVVAKGNKLCYIECVGHDVLPKLVCKLVKIE